MQPLLGILALLLFALPSRAAEFDWVWINDPGNPPDPTLTNPLHSTTGAWHFPCCLGSVPYEFYLTRTEVLVSQYVEYLNAVAADDPNAVYNRWMDVESGCTTQEGVFCMPGLILRSGSPGSYSYSAINGQDAFPVRLINQVMAKRFANWVHNGQPSGPQGPDTTEDGAYTCTGPTSCGPRNPGARAWVPNVDEIHKAAYWDPVVQVWLQWPAGTQATPLAEPPSSGSNSVSTSGAVACHEDQVNGNPPHPRGCEFSPAGSYPNARSPFGVLDLCGSLAEMLETCGETGGVADCSKTLVKMPSWWGHATKDCRSDLMSQAPAASEGMKSAGFRVARLPLEGEIGEAPSRYHCGLLGIEIALPWLAWRLGRRRRARRSRQASGSRLPTSSAGIR